MEGPTSSLQNFEVLQSHLSFSSNLSVVEFLTFKCFLLIKFTLCII